MIPPFPEFVGCADCFEAKFCIDLCRHCAARLVKYRATLVERYATLDRPDPTADERRADARSALDSSYVVES